MKVFVIESSEREMGASNHVEAVRSTLELAEAYVRSRGKVLEWRVYDRAAGASWDATAYVWVGSRRRGSEYVFFVQAYDLV